MFAKLITTSAILAGVAFSATAFAQPFLGDIPKQFTAHSGKTVTQMQTTPAVTEVASWLSLRETHGVDRATAATPRGVAGPVRGEFMTADELRHQASSQEGLSYTLEQIQRTTLR